MSLQKKLKVIEKIPCFFLCLLTVSNDYLNKTSVISQSVSLICGEPDPYRRVGLHRSQVGDLLAAEGAAVLTLTNPLLNALRVEDVQLVAVERRDEVVAQEVAPADGALAPQAAHAVVQPALFLVLRLLVLEFRLLQRRDNLGNW